MLRNFISRRPIPNSYHRNLSFEPLEAKRLLAVDILWANETVNDNGPNDPQFDDYYNQSEQVARDIVNRAIVDWEAVIDSFNDANNPSDTFDLTVLAVGPTDNDTIAGRGSAAPVFANSKPVSATIRLDDNGGGTGWFFDQTPLDDAEFTGIADTFQASFVDATTVGQARQNDFYRTVTHEIGHAMGVRLANIFTLESGNLNIFDHSANNGQGAFISNNQPVNATDPFLGQLTYVGRDQAPGATFNITSNGTLFTFANELWQYTMGSGQTITFTESGGGHFYEGNPDPLVSGADQHLNELMNPGRVVPVGNPAETTRQFISDLTVEFLADAYGYTVTLPSTLHSAHALFDPISGNLLVQGLSGSDTINITTVGSGATEKIRVVVNSTAEEFLRSRVQKLVITGNGGSDMITVAPALESIRQNVDYVVSSNEDALETTGVGDGVVDLDAVVPGNQTTLRGAIRDANALTGAQAIYVGRGTYNLTRTGSESLGDAENDLDITGDLTIIGAGAGETVIDASGFTGGNAYHHRLFQVSGTNAHLALSQMTLTGGHSAGTTSSATGGAILVHLGGAVELDKVAVVGNTSDATGGGIRVASVNSSLTVRNSVFTDNAGGVGGAIYADSASDLRIGNTVFANNTDTSIYNIRNIRRNTNPISEGLNLTDGNAHGFFSTTAGDTIHTGTVDYVVTGLGDTFDATDDATVLSIRDAINDASDDGGTPTIWLPAWHFLLTREKTNTTDYVLSHGDLDVRDDLAIRGVGPGLTVIDASGLGDDGARIFDLWDVVVSSGPTVDISHMSLTGGASSGPTQHGGAILVRNDSTLNASHLVTANNETVNGSMLHSGSIHFERRAGGTITDSVITNNTADYAGGGVMLAIYGTGDNMNGGTFGTVTMTRTVVAKNDNRMTTANADQLFAQGARAFVSGGDNLLQLSSNLYGFIDGQNGDHFGTPDYVVTTIADTFTGIDDEHSLSLREAIHAANTNDNTTEEIWMPAWDFVLSRVRTPMTPDNDAIFGDLDVTDSLILRGISHTSVATKVSWRADLVTDGTASDKVFELLGDYNGTGNVDGNVDAADYTVWRDTLGSTTDLRADGNDDLVIDVADYWIWKDNLGLSLDLENVAV